VRNPVSIVGMKEEIDGNHEHHSHKPMHTRDPYTGMEVRFTAGESKMHTGVVLGARQVQDEYDILLTVRTTSRAVNTVVHLSINDVIELQ
jgi:hypothetical protein